MTRPRTTIAATVRRPLHVDVDTGNGPLIVLLTGFGMPPVLYRPTADLLGRTCRVVIPDIYRVRSRWRRDDIVDQLAATIAEIGANRVTIIGHSFAGGIALSYAARFPERIRELVFADTLCNSREFRLANEATRHPLRLVWMATPSAARSFGVTAITHPRQMLEAGWFGFTSSRYPDIKRVSSLGVASYVLWANRDSILRRSDGASMARELHASFTVARSAHRKPVDHDWVYRHPDLFVDHVQQLDLEALRAACGRGAPSEPSTPGGTANRARTPR